MTLTRCPCASLSTPNKVRLGVYVEVCGEGSRHEGDGRCHIDGLVRSLLAPAIRSVAQETPTCLLRNADARVTY